MRKYPWIAIVAVLAWKIMLFSVSTQPIPANDAYFYDGAVINKILHGGYYNPSLAMALNISGTKLYSTYPPFHQAVLYLWLKLVGVSGARVIAFHVMLFGGFCWVLLLIFRQLEIPALYCNLAGLFLFGITFMDRPDSVAHLMGIISIYCAVRALSVKMEYRGMESGFWFFFMCLFATLNFCTSLQVGGIYFGLLGIASVLSWWSTRKVIPVVWVVMVGIMPALLIQLVKHSLPLAWEGFQEHLHQTPSFTGLRIPTIMEAIKMVRAIPGVFVVGLFLILEWPRFSIKVVRHLISDIRVVIFIALMGAALTVLAASLFVLTPNTIAIASYLQPLIVALYFCLNPSIFGAGNRSVLRTAIVAVAILITLIRPIGMSTWGIACAMDVGHDRAVELIQQEVLSKPAGSRFVVSSALLYDTAKFGDRQMIHSDWLAPASREDSHDSDAAALIRLKPEGMILTQFDYFRRYDVTLEKLNSSGELSSIRIQNCAHTRSPDSFKKFQQVLQNISWAPVIVRFEWKDLSSKKLTK